MTTRTAHVAQANTTARATDYPQWVIVENVDTDAEGMWSDHHTFKAVLKELESCGGADSGFGLMKRLPNGILTTEF